MAGMTAGLVLADLAIGTAAVGVTVLVRQLWPARRSPFRPLAAVLTAVAALALAVTGGRAPCVAAGVLLAATAAGWLIAMASHACSRLRAGGWRALLLRRKVPLRSQVYIWVDGVSGAVMAAFIARQDPVACVTAAVCGLLLPFIRSARLGQARDGRTVALWSLTRRPTPRWPGLTVEPGGGIGEPLVSSRPVASMPDRGQSRDIEG